MNLLCWPPRKRRLLTAGFRALQRHVECAQLCRAALALQESAFGAWRGRARAKALRCSLVTIRGKLHRKVRPAANQLPAALSQQFATGHKRIPGDQVSRTVRMFYRNASRLMLAPTFIARLCFVQDIASEVAVRRQWLLRSAWQALARPLCYGRWAHQRVLLKKAFLALRAAPTVTAERIHCFGVRYAHHESPALCST